MSRKESQKLRSGTTSPKGKPKSFEESELEKMTRELTLECERALDKRFLKLTRGFSNDNPIEEADAKEILRSLIQEAVAYRRLMVGRIERGIEQGALFDRYYGEIRKVNRLTNEASTRMHKMEAAEKEYLRKKAMLHQMETDAYAKYPSEEELKKHAFRADVWAEAEAASRAKEDAQAETFRSGNV